MTHYTKFGVIVDFECARARIYSHSSCYDGYLKYDYYQPRPSATCLKGFKPVLPLGWQISDYALDQMKSSLDSIRPKLNEILGKIPHK
jgi:hypothetical protein